MNKKHYLLIILIVIAIATISNNQNITGNTIIRPICEPKTCLARGLEPVGFFYCDKNKCYRDCYQNDELIEKATFCEKELK